MDENNKESKKHFKNIIDSLKEENERLRKENEKVQLIESELRTHQIELELQNEELKQTQYDLVISRKKYKQLYEDAPVGYIMTDSENVIRELNKRAAKLLKQSKNNVLNKEFSNFVDKEYQDEFYFHFKKANDGKEAAVSQVRLMIQDQLTIVKLSSSLTTDENGSTYVNTTLEDVTEKVKAEQALLEEREKYQDLVESINDVIFQIDKEGYFLYLSPVFDSLYKLEVNDVIGKHFLDFVHPDDAQEIKEKFELILLKGSSSFEARFVDKDGSYRYQIISVNVRYDNEDPIIITGVMTDITDRRIAEKALEESQERLQLAVDAGEIGVWDYDIRKDKLVWDDRMFKIFDISKLEFAHNFSSWSECVHPEDREASSAAVTKAIEEKKPFTIEFRILDKEKKVRYIVGFGKVYVDANDQAYRMTGVNYDITDIKQTENALKESEEKARSYIENAPYGVFISDKDGNWIDVNDAAADQTGYTKEELLRMNLIDIVHENDRELTFQKFNELLTNGRVFLEQSFIRKDGVRRLWEISGVKLSDDLFLGFTSDITERKKAEEEIRLREELFKGAFDRSAIGMLLVDKNGRFRKVNRAIIEMLGYTEEELLQLSFPDITHPDDFGAKIEHVDMIREDRSFFVEKRYRKRNGNYIWCQLSTSIIPDKDGGVKYFISNVQDLTERKENENKIQEYLNQLEDSENKLKELNRSKDRFFSIIASDLRKSLSDFLLLTEEFSMGIKNLTLTQMQQKSKSMHDSSVKLIKVLENLLDWSRAQTGSIKYQPAEYDLYEFAINNILLFKEDASKKRITIKNHIPMDTIVKIDYKMIDAVFRNLISNAVKFTGEDGRIDIIFSEDKDKYIVSVKDNGRGISEDKMSKLFKIGEKIENEDQTQEPGTGLGLILCKEFISLHKGTINVESKPGEGSVFSFTIPKIV